MMESLINTDGHVARLTAEQMQATGIHANLTTTNVRGNVHVLSGSGANVVVLGGNDGILLVDSGFAVSQPEITAALSEISPSPIRYLINSHWHFDHTDGNGWLHDAGASIIAHAQGRVRMSQAQQIPAFSAAFTASAPGALPVVLFRDELALQLDNEDLLLRAYDPAHTDSDISVYFRDANVLHTGDTWFNGLYPFWDADSGGNLEGMIKAAARNLEYANSETRAVPGHGGVGGHVELLDYYEMLVAVRDRVGDQKSRGATYDEVVATKPTAEFDAARAGGFISPELFVWQIYSGL